MIPHYQEASLQGENVAKRRVMKKAKESFEGEEQRALKSGRVLDEVKTAYKTIVQNLQLQLLTMNLTKTTILSIVKSFTRGENPMMEAYREEVAEGLRDEDGSIFDTGPNVGPKLEPTSSLNSLLIGSLGKLVALSSQLRLMCGGLADKVRESGRPITGSGDLSKINSLFSEVRRTFRDDSDDGFNSGLETMLYNLEQMGGQGVPAVVRLAELYEANMMESERIIGGLQRNEYETNIESVFIPSKSTNMIRRGDAASGSERRVFTGEEYKLLVQLRDAGLLRGDDFTSVYSGARDDDSTIASSRSSRSSRSYRQPNIRYSRRGYIKDDDSLSSSDNEGAMLIEGSDSDDDARTTGSGLYSIPASHRFPQRIF